MPITTQRGSDRVYAPAHVSHYNGQPLWRMYLTCPIISRHRSRPQTSYGIIWPHLCLYISNVLGETLDRDDDKLSVLAIKYASGDTPWLVYIIPLEATLAFTTIIKTLPAQAISSGMTPKLNTLPCAHPSSPAYNLRLGNRLHTHLPITSVMTITKLRLPFAPTSNNQERTTYDLDVFHDHFYRSRPRRRFLN